MAYMSQENKTKLSPRIKEVLKKYGMKGTISVPDHYTLVVTVKSGKLDVIGNFMDVGNGQCENRPKSLGVNEYYIHEHFSGEVKDFLTELKDAMNVGNHNKSDIMSDYFDVGWYININIGKYDMPFIFDGFRVTAS